MAYAGGKQIYQDPNQAFAKSDRQFLSSRAGERWPAADTEDGSGRRAIRPNTTSSHVVLPPLTKHNGHANTSQYYGDGYSSRLQNGSAIVRPSTAAPSRSYQQLSPEPKPKETLYPYDMLPPSRNQIPYSPPPSSKTSYSGSSYREGTQSPYPNSPPAYYPRSPQYSKRYSHEYTNGAEDGYGAHTDVAPLRNTLQPRSKRPITTGSSHGRHMGHVGPALAGGIPPVLPKPPTLTGSSSGMPRRSVTKKSRATREEEEAAVLLNTYQ